jgi:HD-GYP domain-containing protein (c-di-GMP phosphodiesterase class II)
MSWAVSLVAEARSRHPKGMAPRERAVMRISAVCFTAVAVAIALWLPSQREADTVLAAGLIVGYAVASRVRFEVGSNYVVPEELLLVPMLLLAPLPSVPIMVAAGSLLAMVPDFADRSWHPERWIGCLADSWFVVGPVLVLAALAPGQPDVDHIGVYLLAFVAQLAGDFAWSSLRDWTVDGLALRDTWDAVIACARFDALLAPLGFLASLAAVSHPLLLIGLAPLVMLLEILSRDRRERFAASIELQRAYRGTVMLLSDVVEHEDSYTADHSRSVVDLAHAVADQLRIDSSAREELEFAALLHDVGKIAIPKEILNKPSSLNDEEFALVKTHTLEGHSMLDRVGGLLGRVGKIVRSCHERWDGKGYPDGLAGEEIPLAARIVFCCDAYSAMTTNRPYRAAIPREQAIEELKAHAGTQFDPRVVEAMTRIVEPEESASADEVRALLAGRPVSTPEYTG